METENLIKDNFKILEEKNIEMFTQPLYLCISYKTSRFRFFSFSVSIFLVWQKFHQSSKQSPDSMTPFFQRCSWFLACPRSLWILLICQHLEYIRGCCVPGFAGSSGPRRRRGKPSTPSPTSSRWRRGPCAAVQRLLEALAGGLVRETDQKLRSRRIPWRTWWILVTVRRRGGLLLGRWWTPRWTPPGLWWSGRTLT